MGRRTIPEQSRQFPRAEACGKITTMSAARDESDDSIDVDDYLRAIAAGASQQPSWLGAARTLSADSSASAALGTIRDVRDSGWLSDEQGFYLVASVVEEVVDAEAAISLHDLDERIQGLEREFGNTDGEPWSDEHRQPKSMRSFWISTRKGGMSCLWRNSPPLASKRSPNCIATIQTPTSRVTPAGEEQFRTKLQLHDAAER